jgi:hypothetical protein
VIAKYRVVSTAIEPPNRREDESNRSQPTNRQFATGVILSFSVDTCQQNIGNSAPFAKLSEHSREPYRLTSSTSIVFRPGSTLY